MRRVLALLGAVLAVAAIAFAVGHDALYRWVALRVVERAAGLPVAVDGSFDVRHAVPLEIRAEDVAVGAEGGPLVARVATLAFRLRPGALLRGRIHLEALEIGGAEIDASLGAPAGVGRGIALPVLERLDIADVTVRVRLGDGALRHEIRIDTLELRGEQDRLRRISGRGSFDGAAGTLEGTVGTLESLLGQDAAPYPIGLELRVPAWSLEAAVRGSVEQPLRGAGLRLDASAAVADVRPLLRLPGVELEEPFAFEAHAVITGDAGAAVLSDLRFDLRAPDRRVLNVEGSVADATARAGIDLRFEVDAREPGLAPLSRRLSLPLASATAKGRVRGDAPALSFSELDLTVTAASGIEMSTSGSIATAVDATGTAKLGQTDARVTLVVPLASFGDALPAWLDPGERIEASGTVRGAADALVLDGVEAAVAGPGATRSTARGRVQTDVQTLMAVGDADRPVDAVVALLARGAEVEARITAPSLATLEPLVGTLPLEPGAWTLTADVRGTGEALVAENVRLKAERTDGVRTVAVGSLADIGPLLAGRPEAFSGLRAEGTVTAPSSTALGAATGVALPDLGRVDASLTVVDEGGWRISKATVNVANDQGLQLTADGSVSAFGGAARAEVTLSARAPNASEALARAGLGAERVGGDALDAKGTVVVEGTTSRYDGEVAIGETRFDARLALDTSGPRPRLDGTLASPLVRLADIGLVGERGEAPEAPTPFIERPIPLDWLGTADLDLEVDVDQVRGVRIAAQDLRAHVKLDDRRLDVDPFETSYEGGSLKGRLGIDGRANPPRFSFAWRGTDLSAGAVLDQFTSEPAGLEGRFTFDGDLRGQGRTLAEIGATLDGHYGHVIENGRLPGGNVDMLVFPAAQLFLSTMTGQSHSSLDCVVMQFGFEEGLGRSEAMYVATPNLRASGTGAINLRERTLDMVIRTESRRRLLLKGGSAVRISGPIGAPELDADVNVKAAGVAIETAGIVMLPPVGLPLAGLSTLGGLVAQDAESPCTHEEAIRRSAPRDDQSRR